jgi:hypothetical protein
VNALGFGATILKISGCPGADSMPANIVRPKSRKP